jgi:hypothetical protein
MLLRSHRVYDGRGRVCNRRAIQQTGCHQNIPQGKELDCEKEREKTGVRAEPWPEAALLCVKRPFPANEVHSQKLRGVLHAAILGGCGRGLLGVGQGRVEGNATGCEGCGQRRWDADVAGEQRTQPTKSHLHGAEEIRNVAKGSGMQM